FAAELGSNRDVLKVRVAAAQSSGRGYSLVERGVNAAGCRADELRQRVDIRVLQLLQLPPVEDAARQVVGERQLLEHFDGCGGGPGLDVSLERRQLQLVKQDFRQLLGRIDIERFTGRLVNLGTERRQLLVDPLRLCGECRPVDSNAGAFHVGKHRN